VTPPDGAWLPAVVNAAVATAPAGAVGPAGTVGPAAPAGPGAAPAGLADRFAALTTAQSAAWGAELAGSFETLGQIRLALARLRRITDAQALARAAPAELCRSAAFARAMISGVSGGVWLPETVHLVTAGGERPAEFAGGDGPSAADRELARRVVELQVRLTPGSVEAEVVRRGVPALVRDATRRGDVFRPLVEMSGARAYVVAPVLAGGRAAGLLHADTGPSGRELGPVDRESIQLFASGFSFLYERAVLLAELDREHARMSEAYASARALLTGADDPAAAYPLPRPAPSPAPAIPDEPLARLTAREREVLEALASGATNARIAARLTLSESTVKTHVRGILRKLGAANRAEAIARYARLAQEQEPAP